MVPRNRSFGAVKCVAALAMTAFLVACGGDGDDDTSAAVSRTCSNAGQCEADQFCETPDNSCAFALGVCKEIPDACSEIFQPVCGCDGEDYANSCLANAAAVSILRPGSCTL